MTQTISYDGAPIPLHFSLLGPFRIQSNIKTETFQSATYARKILAYLAYYGGSHTHQTVFASCWDRELSDDSKDLDNYYRQVQFLYDIIKQFTGGWKQYINKNSLSIGLLPGTYTTDIGQFNMALTEAFNENKSTAERLTQLTIAQKLYRGSLLHGMNCEWIVKSGGEREKYSVKADETLSTITKLQELPSNEHESIISYDFYEMQREIKRAIEQATDEIILYGMNFHVIMPSIKEILFEKLKEEVFIKILFLNPEGSWLRDMALASQNSVKVLSHEGSATLAHLFELRGMWQEEINGIVEKNSETLSLQVFDRMIHGRMYAIDPEKENGILFFTPYIYGVDPGVLPGFSCRRNHGPFKLYLKQLRKLINDNANIDIRNI